MRNCRFSENQIIGILKAGEAGRLVKDVCREHSISGCGCLIIRGGIAPCNDR